MMNIEQLRYFEAVARLGTISAAASELSVTQPALSRSIARLEKELGLELFDRKGKRVLINAAGEELLPHACAILHEERIIRDSMQELADRRRTITIGSIAPAPLWYLTDMIIEQFPDQLLSSKTITLEESSSVLMNGEFDLIISDRAFDYPSVRCAHLMDEQIFVSVPNQSKLATKDKLSAGDLKGETFVMYGGVGFWADVVQSALPHSEFIIQEEYNVFRSLAQSSQAFCFLSDSVYSLWEIPGRTIVPLDIEGVFTRFYLIVRDDAPQVAHDIFDHVKLRACRRNLERSSHKR